MLVFKWWTDLAKPFSPCLRHRLFVLGGFLLLLLSSSSVLALPEDACFKDEKCKEHYSKAIKLYKEEDFDAAMSEFQAAYSVRQMPLLLVNIGRTLQKLGRPKEALVYYERYLQAESKIDPETKKRVDEYIVQVRAAIGPDAAASEKPPASETPKPVPPEVQPPPPLPPPAPPPPPPGRNFIIGGAILTAVGIASIIACVGLAVASQNQFNTFKSSVDEFDKLAAKSSAQSLGYGAIGIGTLGTAAGATGVALIVIGRRMNHRQLETQSNTAAPAPDQESLAPASSPQSPPPANPAVSPPSAQPLSPSSPAMPPPAPTSTSTTPSPQAMLAPFIFGSGAGVALQGAF